MTSAEIATLVPALVAFLVAAAAFLRGEATRKTANTASFKASYAQQATVAHVLTGTDVAHQTADPILGRKAPLMSETTPEATTPPPVSGLVLMGLAAPIETPVPVPPVEGDLPPEATFEPAPAGVPLDQPDYDRTGLFALARWVIAELEKL
jgi:hypothetical protein